MLAEPGARPGRRYGGLLVHIGLAVLAAGHHRLVGARRAGRGDPRRGGERRLRRLPAALRRAHQPRGTAAHGADRPAGAHRRLRNTDRRADPEAEPVPRRVGADRLPFHRPGARLGPVRVGDRAAARRTVRDVPALPQPRRQLAVARRPADGRSVAPQPAGRAETARGPAGARRPRARRRASPSPSEARDARFSHADLGGARCHGGRARRRRAVRLRPHATATPSPLPRWRNVPHRSSPSPASVAVPRTRSGSPTCADTSSS